jgi:hypothetical protein
MQYPIHKHYRSFVLIQKNHPVLERKKAVTTKTKIMTKS